MVSSPEELGELEELRGFGEEETEELGELRESQELGEEIFTSLCFRKTYVLETSMNMCTIRFV